MAAKGTDLSIDHPWLGPLAMQAGPGPDGAPPQLLFCENETNVERLFGATPLTDYPKDGINDHVDPWSRLGQSGADGDQGVVLVPRHRGGGRDREAEAAPPPRHRGAFGL